MMLSDFINYIMTTTRKLGLKMRIIGKQADANDTIRMDAALRKAKDSLGQLFDKNMHDLVRGIRSHKESESKYIADSVEEIKQELKQDNIAVKTNAISKLCYLQMLGYDISWAAFNIIEVMSSTKFTFKRIGYLAASQSFHEGTDVLMLTTNMIRKDLNSQNMFEAGIALAGLSCFLSADLARDLANEIMTLMTSSKAYIRKKAVLLMYKIFLKYPDALRPAFPRLKEKLEDPDPGVQAAAVNVICELARKNPQNYLSLAPTFFKLMNSSTNNWVLIKIIKLFGALTPLEPRLGKKLIEPLTNLIHSTSAMSLLYECINTVIAVLVSISSGLPNHEASVQLCVQKLRILIEDSDQNLKYLGLLAMSKILQTNPKSVQAHKDLVMQCLDDKDESIRLRALNLLYGMVSKKTLMEIIKKLMLHVSKAEGTHYRDELLAKIIEICSQNNYQFITNFEWYVTVLVELTRMEGTKHGKLIASQLLDVAIRVETVREFCVRQMSLLIENLHLFGTQRSNENISEVLFAATWICGEFSKHLDNPLSIMNSMLKANVTSLPGHIQAAFVQNIFKLYAVILNNYLVDENDIDKAKELTKDLYTKMEIFEQSSELEVQERGCMMLQILKYVERMLEKGDTNINNEIQALFEGELNPIAPKAQKKVPIPEGLDLDEWINEPPSESEEEKEELSSKQIFFKDNTFGSANRNNVASSSMYHISSSDYQPYETDKSKEKQQLTDDELRKRREARKIETDSNPFYIKSSSNQNQKKNETASLKTTTSQQSINNENTSLTNAKQPIQIPGVLSSDSYYRMSQIDHENNKLKKKMKEKTSKKSKKKGKNSKNDDEEEEEENETLNNVIIRGFEMPEGARESDDEKKVKIKDVNDPHRALDINLDEPLRDNEKLPVPKHRESGQLKLSNANEKPKKEKEEEKQADKEIPKASTKTKEKEKSEKKSKKEKKHKKEKDTKVTNNHDSLLLQENDDTSKIDDSLNNLKIIEKTNAEKITKITTTTTTNTNTKDDDIEFWLSTTTPTVTETKKETKVVEEKQAVEYEINDNEKSSKSKKHKHKKSKDKKNDDETKKKKNDYENADDLDSLNNTHSSDIANVAHNNNTTSNTKILTHHELASNNNLKLLYEVKPNYMNQNQIIVNIILISSNENGQIYSLELNILDTLNTRLVKEYNNIDSHGTIKIPFNLIANTKQEIQLLFTVEDCTFAQKLKGTLTYMFKNETNNSTHEKLDFKLNLPCTSYLIPTSCSSTEFTDYLSSGELSSKHSIKFQLNSDVKFKDAINRLCVVFRLNVIEIVEQCASLFCTTIKNHPICLLVKLLPDNYLSIDGKSVNNNLIYNVVEECKTIF